jgi:hypothetical protein
MTAAQVLDEGVPGDDDLCRPISFVTRASADGGA